MGANFSMRIPHSLMEGFFMASAPSVTFFGKRKAMLKAIIAGTVVMLSFPIGTANAQGERKYNWEAGFQVTTIQFGAPGEKPLGLGGRFGRQLGNHIT